MDKKEELMRKLAGELLAVEQDRLNGCPDYPAKYVVRMMKEKINEVRAKRENWPFVLNSFSV